MANDILLNRKLIRNNFNVKIIPLSKPRLRLGGEFSVKTVGADLGITFKILKELIFFKPHLIYVGLAQTTLGLWRDCTWIWLATLRGIKALSHMHGGYFRSLYDHGLDPFTQGFVKKTLARLAGIIVLDPSLVFLFHGLVADDRIFVLRNGIPNPYSETQLFEANHRRTNQKQLRVTYLSNLIPDKGFDTFLEAAALLKERGEDPNFLFNLAGAAPTPEIGAQVEKFVKIHGLENSVQVWGKVIGGQKDQLFLSSDVFVFPTQYTPEGQPVVIIEALAAGLPVIATARGCIPAMVRDSVNGFMVPEGDATAIADRLKVLSDDAPLRLSMGEASRKLFQVNYTAEKFAEGFAAILQKAMGVL